MTSSSSSFTTLPASASVSTENIFTEKYFLLITCNLILIYLLRYIITNNGGGGKGKKE